jgi:hypothetical protein
VTCQRCGFAMREQYLAFEPQGITTVIYCWVCDRCERGVPHESAAGETHLVIRHVGNAFDVEMTS